MSSFVISKGEYAKAAGFLSAIVEAKNYYREPVLSLWNKAQCRRYTAEDVRRDFSRLYEINAAAVAEQYHDPEREHDPDAHDAAFAAGKSRGEQLMRQGYSMERSKPRRDLQRATYGCIQFFHSALHQIESDEYQRRALRILNKYFRGLYEVLRKLDGVTDDDCRSWGSFDALDLSEEV